MRWYLLHEHVPQLFRRHKPLACELCANLIHDTLVLGFALRKQRCLRGVSNELAITRRC